MIKRKKCGQQYDDELNARHKCETDSSTTDTSSFSNQQQPFQDSTPVLTTGATSDCYRVKLYGKLHFLKRLKPEFSGNPRYRAAMRKEFETGYNLDHPNLVRYMSCGDDYLLTEWVDGITLGELWDQTLFYSECFSISRELNRWRSAVLPDNLSFRVTMPVIYQLGTVLERTDGYAFVPRSYIREQLEHHTLHTIPLLFEAPPPIYTYAAAKKSQMQSYRIRAFLTELRNHVSGKPHAT